MKSLDEKIAHSLTADTVELLPYLPYLLQDLWDLGSSPKDIINLVEKHHAVSHDSKILDLGCGKGAVSIQLAKTFGCYIKGIDIMPEFIEYAQKKACDYDLSTSYEFCVGNIMKEVNTEKDYDVVILGAVGDVLGPPQETIRKLAHCVKKRGYIIIDDVYGNESVNSIYPTREQWLTFFMHEHVILIDEMFNNEQELQTLNRKQQSHIVRRAQELALLYPDKKNLFDRYVVTQQEECDELEQELTGVTMLLQTM